MNFKWPPFVAFAWHLCFFAASVLSDHRCTLTGKSLFLQPQLLLGLNGVRIDRWKFNWDVFLILENVLSAKNLFSFGIKTLWKCFLWYCCVFYVIAVFVTLYFTKNQIEVFQQIKTLNKKIATNWKPVRLKIGLFRQLLGAFRQFLGIN